MLERFFPDYMYPTVQDIKAGFFLKHGIRLAILDIDNTLVPYTQPDPTPAARAFLKQLADEGVRFCFVSNNKKERVQRFNQTIDTFFIARANKPFRTGICKAMQYFGVKPEETVLIGDQIFTDVYGGRRSGVLTVLVQPIEDKETLFFRFKRRMEKIVLKKYNEVNGNV